MFILSSLTSLSYYTTIQSTVTEVITATETVRGPPAVAYTVITSHFPNLSLASFPDPWMTATGDVLALLNSDRSRSLHNIAAMPSISESSIDSFLYSNTTSSEDSDISIHNHTSTSFSWNAFSSALLMNFSSPTQVSQSSKITSPVKAENTVIPFSIAEQTTSSDTYNDITSSTGWFAPTDVQPHYLYATLSTTTNPSSLLVSSDDLVIPAIGLSSVSAPSTLPILRHSVWRHLQPGCRHNAQQGLFPNHRLGTPGILSGYLLLLVTLASVPCFRVFARFIRTRRSWMRRIDHQHELGENVQEYEYEHDQLEFGRARKHLLAV